MLAAVLHGKAGRISIDGENQSWREVFRQREDLLTATIFGRFPYLSEQGERDFLNIFCNYLAPPFTAKLSVCQSYPVTLKP